VAQPDDSLDVLAADVPSNGGMGVILTVEFRPLRSQPASEG
jgi:hypothetical protein